jgi:hypothetical protein
MAGMRNPSTSSRSSAKGEPAEGPANVMIPPSAITAACRTSRPGPNQASGALTFRDGLTREP